MPYKDPEKRRAYHREYWKRHYQENKDRYVGRVAERKKEIMDWFVALKSDMCCNRCPEDDSVCLEFHHLESEEKDLAVSTMVCEGYGRERILEEMAKCEVLCANCHRKEHRGCSV